VPHQNATTIQVAIGVVAAITWMLENPRRIVFSEDLPHDYILNIAKPYLGKFISEPSNWTPLTIIRYSSSKILMPADKTDPWQFKTLH